MSDASSSDDARARAFARAASPDSLAASMARFNQRRPSSWSPFSQSAPATSSATATSLESPAAPAGMRSIAAVMSSSSNVVDETKIPGGSHARLVSRRRRPIDSLLHACAMVKRGHGHRARSMRPRSANGSIRTRISRREQFGTTFSRSGPRSGPWHSRSSTVRLRTPERHARATQSLRHRSCRTAIVAPVRTHDSVPSGRGIASMFATNQEDASRDLGKYRVLAELGRGGMGVVSLAVLRGPGGFHKLLAVKELRPEFVRSPALVAMFVDEARLAARLSHPNIVQTLEAGAEEGRPVPRDGVPRGPTPARRHAARPRRFEPHPPPDAHGHPRGCPFRTRLRPRPRRLRRSAPRHRPSRHQPPQHRPHLRRANEARRLRRLGRRAASARPRAGTNATSSSARPGTWPPSKRRAVRWIAAPTSLPSA